ncbi:helix-turn-helix domain-containing protein [Allosphingosinicella sp.]|uniref:AraC family transcriptional regulator n=1 Tax=Allosphingosinicella sp. TaxID=2823234 RepID=UPI002FC0AF9F
MRDHFAYSSEGRPEGQAFEEYAHLYSHGSDVTRGDGPFHARVRAWRHHGFILFDRFMTGLVHSRDARVTTDGYAHLVAHAMLEGELDWSEPDGGKTARAGDILFMDTTQPSRTMPREAHLLTVSIGRHLVEPATGPVGPLHGRLVSPPATLLLTDFLVSLAHRAPMLPDDGSPVYSRVLAELISAVLFGDAASGSAARRLHAARLDAVERCIASSLGDRRLSAETIAAAAGLSRSGLYRLLQDRGGVARLIRTRRLQAVRSAIDNGTEATLAELAHACGFASESHMSRQFHEAFGCPPGAYRRMVQGLADDDALKGYRRWQGWMGTLR